MIQEEAIGNYCALIAMKESVIYSQYYNIMGDKTDIFFEELVSGNREKRKLEEISFNVLVRDGECKNCGRGPASSIKINQ